MHEVKATFFRVLASPLTTVRDLQNRLGFEQANVSQQLAVAVRTELKSLRNKA